MRAYRPYATQMSSREVVVARGERWLLCWDGVDRLEVGLAFFGMPEEGRSESQFVRKLSVPTRVGAAECGGEGSG